MEEAAHAKPFSMAFCLDCHRDPASRLRPPDRITELGWTWSPDPAQAGQQQRAQGTKFVRDWNVESLQSCSACHR
jgi:hypothetical protein